VNSGISPEERQLSFAPAKCNTVGELSNTDNISNETVISARKTKEERQQRKTGI
jgi:hypothetical protein